MNSFKKSVLIMLSFFAMLGLQACEEEGPFEETGENIDEGVENTGETLDDAGDEVQSEFD